jgi:hypothetical protein
VPELPYPHARNDCEMCRERDADFHVLGEEWNKPGKRPLLLCQGCLGRWAVTVVYMLTSLDAVGQREPAEVTLAIPPGRPPWTGSSHA